MVHRQLVVNELRALQEKQRAHDELLSSPVMTLSLVRSMEYSVRRWTILCGALAELETGEVNKFARISIDVFMACMASANSLQIDLATHLLGEHAAKLHELPEIIRTLYVRAGQPRFDRDEHLWLCSELAKSNGRLAKLCEEHDLGRKHDYVKGWSCGVVTIARDVLIMCHVKHFPIGSMMTARWTALERHPH